MKLLRTSLHTANDLAGAIWYGGNIFGITAMNPAVSQAGSHEERGAVANQAWENFIPMGLGSALLFGVTYAAMRFDEPRLSNPNLRALTTIRDISAASMVALTLAGGVLNRITAESVPGDRTPMEDGLTPAEEAPAPAKQSLLGLRLIAAGNLIAGTTYFVTTAIQEQALMEQGPMGRFALPFQRASRAGSVALEAAKGLAAAEMLRRGVRMIGEGIGVRQPEPRSRWQQIGDQARLQAQQIGGQARHIGGQARHVWEERVAHAR
jgi:hypothetical protein